MKQRIAIAWIAVLVLCVWMAAVADAATQYAQVVTQKGPLNMRKSTSVKSDIADKIPKDTVITVAPVDADWYQCTYNGKNGYVMAKYLLFLDSSQFRALSLHDSGQDVLAMKEKLKALYFFDGDTPIDDQYDAGTQVAVKQFQAAQGSAETGILSAEEQALLFWGDAKNNLPTRRMTVTVASKCSGYNHVGNSWSRYYSINGEKVSSGDSLEIVLGDSIVVYAKITESDTSPDAGSAKETVEITQDRYDNGFTVTQKISVREDKGRYAGNKAYWTVTFTFAP